MRLEISAQELRAFSDGLNATQQEINRALMRTVNRVAAMAKTRSKRAITQQVALKSGTVGEKLNLQKATLNNPKAVISTPRRGLRMEFYKNSQAYMRGRAKRTSKGKARKVGIRITVKPGKAKILNRAFYSKGRIKMFYGGRVHQIYGPSTSQVWNLTREQLRPDIIADMNAMAREELRFIVTGSRR